MATSGCSAAPGHGVVTQAVTPHHEIGLAAYDSDLSRQLQTNAGVAIPAIYLTDQRSHLMSAAITAMYHRLEPIRPRRGCTTSMHWPFLKVALQVDDGVLSYQRCARGVSREGWSPTTCHLVVNVQAGDAVCVSNRHTLPELDNLSKYAARVNYRSDMLMMMTEPQPANERHQQVNDIRYECPRPRLRRNSAARGADFASELDAFGRPSTVSFLDSARRRCHHRVLTQQTCASNSRGFFTEGTRAINNSAPRPPRTPE